MLLNVNVLVDRLNLLALEPQFDHPTNERVLAVGRVDVALNLQLHDRAPIHERLPSRRRRGQLLAPTHRSPARSTPPKGPVRRLLSGSVQLEVRRNQW